MPGGITLEELPHVMSEMRSEILREPKKDLRSLGQRLAGLEQDAWQPRPAMEEDGLENTKTRERTEDAATAVQAVHGDRFSAEMI